MIVAPLVKLDIIIDFESVDIGSNPVGGVWNVGRVWLNAFLC